MSTLSRLRKVSGKLSGKLAETGPIVVIDCLRAVFELGRANRKFRKLSPGELVDQVGVQPGGLAARTDHRVSEPMERRAIVERVAFAIPAIALRVPWRSDCMVQAMAAQHWLDRYKIPSTMTIGVRNDAPTGSGNGPGTGFGAHAWLKVGEMLVTGGDITGYQAIEVQSSNPDSQRS